ncbi:hypothetical protein ACRAWF_31210 [Streptomyces sp. L7]
MPTYGERFYGWMYATRGVPLGAAALVAPLAWPGPAAAALVLCAAAAAQVGDAVIGDHHPEDDDDRGRLAPDRDTHVATAVATA